LGADAQGRYALQLFGSGEINATKDAERPRLKTAARSAPRRLLR
jgi:hypothetical protein